MEGVPSADGQSACPILILLGRRNREMCTLWQTKLYWKTAKL